MHFSALIVAAFLAANPLGWDVAGPLRFALVSTIGFASIAASLGAGDARPRPLPRWSVLGWVILLFGMVVSTVLSGDLWHAVIGTPDRHFGLATWFLLAGLFAVSSIYPNSILHFVVGATMVGATGAAAWSILEHFDVGWFASDFAGGRAGGPFLQPAYLGYAMVLAIPVSIGAAMRSTSSTPMRAAAGLAAVVATIGLGLSESRGAWVAVAIAMALLLVRRRLWVASALTVAAVALVLAFTPAGERIATLGDDGGVVAGRLDEWQVGARALTDTPTFGITGHGPEGYRIVFGQHVDDQYVIDYGRDVFTDRAHNGLLDIALTGGLLSGIGAVLLYGGLAITSVQRLRADDWIDAGLGAAVLAGTLQQLVLFPLAEVDPVLWVLAGLLVARRPTREFYRPPLFRKVSGGKRVAMLAAGLLATLSAIGGLSDIAADRAVVAAIDSLEAESADVVELSDRARSRRPDSIRYDFIAARSATRVGRLDDALDRLDNGLGVSPNDPALRIERATLLLEVARGTQDPAALTTAGEELEALAVDEPRHPVVLNDLGIARALAENDAGAIDAFERAATLDPTNVEPLINLAVVHLENGDLALGEQILDRVEAITLDNAQVQSLRREFLSE